MASLLLLLCFAHLAVRALARNVTTEEDLRAALYSSDGGVIFLLAVDITLTEPLVISGHHLVLRGGGGSSVLRGDVVLSAAHNVSLSSLRVTGRVRVLHSSLVRVHDVGIGGGLLLHSSSGVDVGHSRVSNPNGTCVQVAACGNATTLQACNVTIHDNYISQCRTTPGGSPYAPSAQGITLGGAEGSDECTVGVIVRNNDVRGVDEMGIRVNNDNYGSCVNNVVTLNRVTDWGQLAASEGGDTTDSGCLYLYGHWFSPGNVVLYNECVSTNASWGQNGVYLDDASSGQVVIGNVFRGAVAGSPIKLNGGAFNTIHSNLVIGGINLGYGNCRGLRGVPALRYTCENYGKWMAVLAGDDYLSPPWSTSFPWYAGWCTNTTAGPNAAECAPTGAPDGYCCEVLSRGNAVSRLAGVWMARPDPDPFTISTAPGFPEDVYGHCPEYVVNASFNAVDWASVGNFYSTDQFVNASGGDWTLRPDSDVYRDMPDFARIPYTSIGPGARPPADP